MAAPTRHTTGPNRHIYNPNRGAAPVLPPKSSLSIFSGWLRDTQTPSESLSQPVARTLANAIASTITERNISSPDATPSREIDMLHEWHWQARYLAANFILISALAVCALPTYSSMRPNRTVVVSLVAAASLMVFDYVCFVVYPDFGTTYRLVDIAIRSGVWILVWLDSTIENAIGGPPMEDEVVQIDIEELEGCQVEDTEDEEEEKLTDADKEGLELACQLRNGMVDSPALRMLAVPGWGQGRRRV